ncbi:MAG: glycoside hydrolase family 127 protein, partial [Opitutales bacterium]|nr:glycoside hydrolase family 127 protein [Opitutales bacterium]
MKRFYLSILIGAFTNVNLLFAGDVVKPKVDDAFKYSEPTKVELQGVLGDTLELSLHGDVLVCEIDSLVTPFRTRPETRRWDCEFWGKWFTGALLAYDYKPSYYFKARLDKSIADLMSTQDEYGSITTYQKAHEFKLNETGGFGYKDKISWDLWGRKYTLLGLLDYYTRTGDKKVLDSARRHTDYIMQHVGEGKKDIVQIGCWFGCASTSILEPIVLLYRATGEQKYLDYANWIVGRWEKSPIKPDLLNKALKNTDVLDMFYDGKEPLNLNQYLKCGLSKAYEMASCFEGLAELYRTTGDEKYLKAVLNHARSIRDTEINVVGSGAIHEQWVKGKFIQTNGHLCWNEVCVTATWIKLCG